MSLRCCLMPIGCRREVAYVFATLAIAYVFAVVRSSAYVFAVCPWPIGRLLVVAYVFAVVVSHVFLRSFVSAVRAFRHCIVASCASVACCSHWRVQFLICVLCSVD